MQHINFIHDKGKWVHDKLLAADTYVNSAVCILEEIYI